MNAPQGTLGFGNNPFVRDAVTAVLAENRTLGFTVLMLADRTGTRRDAVQSALTQMLKHGVAERSPIQNSNGYTYRAGPNVEWGVKMKGTRYPLRKRRARKASVQTADAKNDQAMIVSIRVGKSVCAADINEWEAVYKKLRAWFERGQA